MAIVVSDNFNRADNPTSLGTATTGQVWATVPGEGNVLPGDPYGILSNQAWWNRNGTGAGGDGLVALETGLIGAKVSVKLMDVLAGGVLNLRNMGILFHYVDTTHYVFATYARAGGGLWRLYIADGGSPTHRGPDSVAAFVDGDVMSVEFCGQDIGIRLNGVMAQNYPVTIFPPMSAALLAGTKCGLQSSGGVISSPPFQLFDDFLVEAFGTCTPTYNCTVDGCVDPGDGSGTFGTLEACLASCGIAESYNCVDGVCVDPGDGSGAFATLLECQTSGCQSTIPGAVTTETFDEGEGGSYYVVAQVTDSGSELRSKNIKSVRTTGRRTNSSAMIFGYDINDPISTEDLETGTRSNTRMITRPQNFVDSTDVTQSERKPVNVSNAVLWTVRQEGDDTGKEERDRIDEIVCEVSEQGVRR